MTIRQQTQEWKRQLFTPVDEDVLDASGVRGVRVPVLEGKVDEVDSVLARTAIGGRQVVLAAAAQEDIDVGAEGVGVADLVRGDFVFRVTVQDVGAVGRRGGVCYASLPLCQILLSDNNEMLVDLLTSHDEAGL